MKSTVRQVKSFRKAGIIFIMLLFTMSFAVDAFARKIPPSIEECAAEPVKYVGTRDTDKHFYDGALRHAVGVQRYQVLRANRSKPLEGEKLGWTYNHQPYLVYWNGKFYCKRKVINQRGSYV